MLVPVRHRTYSLNNVVRSDRTRKIVKAIVVTNDDGSTETIEGGSSPDGTVSVFAVVCGKYNGRTGTVIREMAKCFVIALDGGHATLQKRMVKLKPSQDALDDGNIKK